MRTIFFIVTFLIFGALFIFSNNNLHIQNLDERAEFLSNYGSWFVSIFSNVGSITAHAVNLDWVPKSNSFIIPILAG